ncbi:uncharacterized protein CANTADRAFT_3595 [Suhomyces tanzawaensis NRRL Y-17324]|uniref:Uncharacterized protein n=1 Tax=Suhomyces tanzawaensis NRRL Y-17324 TaxID=984487 RepID=A0A1E4SPS0_9ASCO|nr:uncharacterized protein CANTADRAFT_3595 [Suhomyces tanzawaensis NRRL Y-17324]ODV81495.1 hypothetical protein CANTADRAFT_3595 [Suhomyces tanzawaensis NRRL Y-17324]
MYRSLGYLGDLKQAGMPSLFLWINGYNDKQSLYRGVVDFDKQRFLVTEEDRPVVFNGHVGPRHDVDCPVKESDYYCVYVAIPVNATSLVHVDFHQAHGNLPYYSYVHYTQQKYVVLPSQVLHFINISYVLIYSSFNVFVQFLILLLAMGYGIVHSHKLGSRNPLVYLKRASALLFGNLGVLATMVVWSRFILAPPSTMANWDDQLVWVFFGFHMQTLKPTWLQLVASDIMGIFNSIWFMGQILSYIELRVFTASFSAPYKNQINSKITRSVVVVTFFILCAHRVEVSIISKTKLNFGIGLADGPLQFYMGFGHVIFFIMVIVLFAIFINDNSRLCVENGATQENKRIHFEKELDEEPVQDTA